MRADARRQLMERRPPADRERHVTNLVVQPEAEADLAEAFGWYQARLLGLGHELLGEVDSAFARIVDNPALHRVHHRGARRAHLRRFPFVVLYVLRADTVFVLAVLHERRDPKLFGRRARSFHKPE